MGNKKLESLGRKLMEGEEDIQAINTMSVYQATWLINQGGGIGQKVYRLACLNLG